MSEDLIGQFLVAVGGGLTVVVVHELAVRFVDGEQPFKKKSLSFYVSTR